jgi:hypothetical protein
MLAMLYGREISMSEAEFSAEIRTDIENIIFKE